jgi:hypothetical protein
MIHDEQIREAQEREQGTARPPRRRWIAVIVAAIVAVLLLTVAVAAVIGPVDRQVGPASKNAGRGEVRPLSRAARPETQGMTIAGSAGAAATTDAAGAPVPSTIAAGGPTGMLGAPAGVPTRVIKTGSVDIEVARGRFGTAIARLTTLAAGLGGFVSDSKTFETGKIPAGAVTLRVPSSSFEDALNQARRIGTVRSLTSSGQDVTAEYTDLEARLRALSATRDRLLTLLAKAATVQDILAVQDRVNTVQVEIEQVQGRQRLLDSQTSFGSLAVSVTEKGGRTDHHRSGIARAWDDGVGGFVRGIEAVLAHSGTALLVVMLLGLAALAGRGGWRVVRKRVT